MLQATNSVRLSTYNRRVGEYRYNRRSSSIGRFSILLSFQQEHIHIILALDVHLAARLELISFRQNVQAIAGHLYPTGDPGGVHSRRYVDCVAPDVVIQLGSADHASRDVAVVEADSQNQFETQQVPIEIIDYFVHRHGKVHQLKEMRVFVLALLPHLRIQTTRGHEGAADRLDLQIGRAHV